MAQTESGESKNAAASGRRWSFGNAVLDERSFRLYVNSKPVELERKPLEVLQHLLRHAGELVTKDALLAAVWPGRILSDSTITSCVKKLREVLDDDDQRVIATVHGQGYRLDAEVRSVDAVTPLPLAGESGPEGRERAAQPSRRLAAIMFTDLVGYSELAHRDEALAIELLELHRGWVREILPMHGGKEIETVGDAFLIEFSGALAAVECAVAIQQRFTEHNAAAPDTRRMQLRIGIHLGDVEHKADKVMGDGVNIASRIHGMAEPGGICVSESVYQAVRSRSAVQFASLGRPVLKNIELSLELFRVLSPGQEAVPPNKSAPSAAASTVKRRGWRAIAVAAVVVASVLLATWLVTRDRSAVQPSVASIAVLPFVNLSPDPENEYFSDGMTEELINALSNVEGLRVPSRTSVFAFKGKQQDIRHIGKELNVQTVLEGSVRKDKDKLRITAQLINIADGYHIWSQTYERTSNDVFAVQNELAQAIVGKLKPQLLAASSQTLVHQGTSNPEAYDAYLRGKHDYFFQDETASSRSIEMLRHATTLDPNFARAHATLAQVLANRLNYIAPSDEHAAKEGFSAAERALALDPTLGEAYLARGRLHWTPLSNFQHEAAIKSLKRALELDPDLRDAWLTLAGVFYHLGLFEQAEKANDKAVALDSTSPGVRMQQAIVHLFLEKFELSLDEAEQIPRNFNPTLWYVVTMLDLMRLDRTREAAARYEEFLRSHPDEGGLAAAINARLLAVTGQTAEAELEIKRALTGESPFGHFHDTAYSVGAAYALMGKIPEAMHWLEHAEQTGFPNYTWLTRDPHLDKLRGTPRFDKLLEKTRKQWEYFKLIAETMPW